MQKIVWELEYLSTPKVIRYCKKCGKKTYYKSSGLFRVNAQKKSLDIWMIYKCEHCDYTWNAGIYARVNPQKFSEKDLERFYTNDSQLAQEYAMNVSWLKRNQIEVILPEYKIKGEELSSSISTEIYIINPAAIPYKISEVLRKKLSLSQKEYTDMLQKGTIKSVEGKELKKAKLSKREVVIFQP